MTGRSDGGPSETTAQRLEREAGFQDRRTLAGGSEARDRFYWLIEGAYAEFDRALTALGAKSVLVVGCGVGTVAPLARQGARVVGIDISPAAVEWQRDVVRREGLEDRAEVHLMDAEDLALPAASFDAIVCTGVLHHLDVERACRSWTRVLRADGQLVMVEPLAGNPIVALYRWLTPSQRTPDEHPLVPADFRRLRSHFERVDMQAYGLLTLLCLPLSYLPGASGPKRRLLGWLARADRVLFRWIPAARHLAWTSFIRCTAPRHVGLAEGSP